MAASPSRGNKVMYLVNAKELLKNTQSIPTWMLVGSLDHAIDNTQSNITRENSIITTVLVLNLLFGCMFYPIFFGSTIGAKFILYSLCWTVLTLILLLFVSSYVFDAMQVSLSKAGYDRLIFLKKFLKLPNKPLLQDCAVNTRRGCREYLYIRAVKIVEIEYDLKNLAGPSQIVAQDELYFVRKEFNDAFDIFSVLGLVTEKKKSFFKEQPSGGMTGF
jgi:hypothetical protein